MSELKLTLREMRNRNNMTQREVADHFDVHINTIINWEKERNANTLTLRKVLPLLEYYGYDISQLKI